jgi:hypothetical protein
MWPSTEALTGHAQWGINMPCTLQELKDHKTTETAAEQSRDVMSLSLFSLSLSLSLSLSVLEAGMII